MTEQNIPIGREYKTWRAILPVHPACEIIPEYSPEKLRELGRSIREANRMNVPVIVFVDLATGRLVLLDGRSRLDGMAAIGIKFRIEITAEDKVRIVAPGYDIPEPQVIIPDDKFDPYSFVAATNIARRHLSPAERRKYASNLILAQPTWSNHWIAKLAGIDHKTAAAVREQMHANGEIPHNPDRIEKTGRKARGRKPAQGKPSTAPVPVAPIIEPVAKHPNNDVSVTMLVDPRSVCAVNDKVATLADAILALSGHPTAANFDTIREKATEIVRLTKRAPVLDRTLIHKAMNLAA